MNIYGIYFNDRDDNNYPYSELREEPFFTSREKAEEWIAENEQTSAEGVRSVLEGRRKQQFREYRLGVIEHNALVVAGLRQEIKTVPSEPHPVTDEEVKVEMMRRGGYYSVAEIEVEE